MKAAIAIGILLTLLVSAGTGLADSVTTFTYRSPESATDRRYVYDNTLLQLALEKTKPKWGKYNLVPSPVMNYSRAIAMLLNDELVNPMFKLSATNEYCSKMGYASFPVDLGIVGYRVFFTSTAIEKKLAEIRDIDELKKFSMGQGYGWLDVKILRMGGFNVIEIPNYDSLFQMVSMQRFDLLPRGINEVAMEYEAHKKLPNFLLSHHVGIHYPLPRFFFTNKKNHKAAQRVFEGLAMAYNDGSLQALWEKEYRMGLDFGQFDRIRFFKIENPFISDIDPVYMRFMPESRRSVKSP